MGPVAHGGHCVVRLPAPESRVVFTRHALPGETVVVEITEGTDGDRFWRGDAVRVLTPSPVRVEAPCPVAGPGLCGGCDFQHVALSGQRDLKAAVVREQLRRLAGLDLDVTVEPVPGDVDGLRWRTRQRYVELPDGRRGMRKHRSHDVVAVDDCLIEAPGRRRRTRSWPHVLRRRRRLLAGAPGRAAGSGGDGAAALDPQPGERALDLYAGVGLFAGFLADGSADGPGRGRCAVEADGLACSHAERNLGDGYAWCGTGRPGARLGRVRRRSTWWSWTRPARAPSAGSWSRSSTRSPRAVAYVACDPAALARDVAIFAEHGYALASLRAFDLFPMTHHVECVALLRKPTLTCGEAIWAAAVDLANGP